MKSSLPPALRKSAEILLFFCLLLFLPLLFPESAQGAIYRVNSNGTGSKTGVDWDNALGEAEFITKLKEVTVVSGDEFWVAAGSYRPTLTSGDVGASFTMKPGVSLYGGFSDTEKETERDQRNPKVNVTILTGDIGRDDTGNMEDKATRGIVGVNSARVVVAGNTVDAAAVIDGFVITAGHSTSRANDDGGGMRISGGSPVVKNCTFMGNTSDGSAGGLSASGGTPTVTNCIFSQNTAGVGGAMCILSGAAVTVTNCTFTGNSAGYGGGVEVFNGTSTLTNCTFSGNSASSDGGGIYQYYGTSTLTSCTFSENSADYGGGIFVEELGTSTLTNCTFSGNSADYGGGLYLYYGTSTLTNCILWGDAGGEIAYVNRPTVSYSVVQGGFAGGTEIVTEDPLLGPLADNGGLTRTHALLPGSSAIDRGTNTGAPATDQRGVSRPRGLGVDIGAYEFGGPDAPLLILPADGAIDAPLIPTLTTGSFHSPDPCIHAATEWQVDDDDTFTLPLVWNYTTGPLTERTLPGNVLDYGKAYFWRVRFQDDCGTWSPWSQVRSFTTERMSGSGCDAGGSGSILMLAPLALLAFKRKR